MHVLGIKAVGHDTGAALIANGKIVAVAEERLSRVKYGHGAFPRLSIAYCLEALNLTPADIDLVVIDRMPVEKGVEVSGRELFLEEAKGAYTKARIETSNHHDAHAAAAFFCSPFEESAVLVYDGNGEVFTSNTGVRVTETETLYRGKGNQLVQISKSTHAQVNRRYPYTTGIGKLYSRLSRDCLGFGDHNEGKMMGLAGYGDDSLLKQFPYERWTREHYGQMVCNSRIEFSTNAAKKIADRSFVRNLRVIYWGMRIRLKKVLGSGFGSALRDPNIFTPVVLPRPARDPKTDQLPDSYYTSVAFAAQRIFEHFAIQLGMKLKAVTQSKNLCVAGGCALNIDANRNFLTEVGFDDLFVQPASSDCGIALGCALWGLHVVLEQPRFWEMKSASLGRSYSLSEIDSALAARAGEIESHISQNAPKEAAQLIADGQIIGWFQGGSEYGPRALGNRSIICDPRNPQMRDILNARVKHREMWRPFAASILSEKLHEWFDLRSNTATAFMLLAGSVLEEKRELIPSVVHVDNTCRMQTLTEEANGPYYKLVKAFEDLTGFPLVLNTSFNLGGDPIVESPADAIDTFLRTDMDYLVLHDRVVKKKSPERTAASGLN